MPLESETSTVYVIDEPDTQHCYYFKVWLNGQLQGEVGTITVGEYDELTCIVELHEAVVDAYAYVVSDVPLAGKYVQVYMNDFTAPLLSGTTDANGRITVSLTGKLTPYAGSYFTLQAKCASVGCVSESLCRTAFPAGFVNCDP